MIEIGTCLDPGGGWVEMMWWNHGSGSGYAIMMLGMIALGALLVWAVVALSRNDSRHDFRAPPGGSAKTSTAGAEQILAERFARGDIDVDDYHRRLADLHPQPAGTKV